MNKIAITRAHLEKSGLFGFGEKTEAERPHPAKETPEGIMLGYENPEMEELAARIYQAILQQRSEREKRLAEMLGVSPEEVDLDALHVYPDETASPFYRTPAGLASPLEVSPLDGIQQGQIVYSLLDKGEWLTPKEKSE